MAVSKIEIEKHIKKKMIEEIIEYYRIENDEEIGVLKGELILDFIIEKIAPEFYNKGLRDAEAYITNALDDIKSMEK